MELKKDILWRVYLIYFLMCVFGVSIIAKVATIQFVEGDVWKSKAQTLTRAYMNIDAIRGNIYDSEGSLLATSLPYYEVGMDVNTGYLTNKVFYDEVDSLALCLSNIFTSKSKKQFYKQLVKARKSGDRYIVLARNVSYKDLQKIKTFPILRKGKNKGGLIVLQTNRRELPFKYLAARTIGYDRADNLKPVGIEGAFNNYLKGVGGKRLMQKVAGGVWMPLSDENEVEPQDGNDLISTIDINIQDVAEHALLNQLIKNKAAYGCVVLMEVETGYIKAIANLSKVDSSTYKESFNYAIGAASEPGSTFKLASLLAAIDDGYVDLDDMIDLEKGQYKYYDRIMKDSHEPEINRVSVQRVFETSSNVGVSKIITQYYSKNPQKFIDKLYAMGLADPLKISIPGEAKARIKTTKDKDWYGTSLPWISIGYESLLSPLKTLCLYNAVANDGVMVKPLLIKEIKKRGTTIKKYSTEIINPAICSKATIKKAQQMLEGVVSNGTATNLKAASYKVAGKTGTAQIANNGLYKNGSKVSYQASFVGYFPADNPKYSCIVVVNGPSNGIYYGNVVAGPIFKEIADKVYANSLEIHPEINSNTSPHLTYYPALKNTNKDETQMVLNALKIPLSANNVNSEWLKTLRPDSSKVVFKSNNVEEVLDKGIVPDITGMPIQDVLYLLENRGIKLLVSGKGTVVKQSINPGSKYYKGMTLSLELS